MDAMEINMPFGGIYKNKRVLVTGDTGFKGSWLALWLSELGAEVFGFSLPPKSTFDNYVTVGLSDKIHHQDGDIRDYTSLLNYFKKVQPDIAFHLAAQALVIESFNDPAYTFETNVTGTVNFFEAVRQTASVRAALNITSDKCYENKEIIWGYRETDPMGGKDPYSASKGCSELVTNSYCYSFFQDLNSTNIASARAGNVIGGGDWAENRIIPDFFRAVKQNEVLKIRNPYNTRPWQFVLEPLRGYLMLAESLFNDFGKDKKMQGGWNFGPEEENNVSVIQLVECVIEELRNGKYELLSKDSNFIEASFLRLDISKAKTLLNWKPLLNFKETIQFTVAGYNDELEKPITVYESRIKQIQEFQSLNGFRN